MNKNEVLKVIRDAKERNQRRLYLTYKDLTSIPPEIGQLTNLMKLYLRENNLTSLPPEIGQLTNLTELDLDLNNLTSIPPEIGQLTNLMKLNLWRNNLTSLPPEIGQLTDLTVLELYVNPLESPPPEIVKQGVRAIREYLNLLKKEGGRRVYEAKLLIVGQGGVGKTSLRNKLIHDTYNDKEPSTRGISLERTEVTEWPLSAPGKAQTPVTMNVWDFGGQEIYHATHQFFLTKRSAYLLVWDARQEHEYGRLDYWLHIIETYGGDSPIILVLNKCDEHISDINHKDLKKRFPQIKGFYRVSCKAPKEGPDSFEKLTAEIDEDVRELPLIGNPWPISWWKVRETLEAEKRKQIDYSEYLEICSKRGIEEEQANMLSTYLHDLGVVLHFKEDSHLKLTMILDSEWATRAVYKVLDAAEPRERGGILKEGDLDKIWRKKDGYPPDKHQTLLRLMANFELAFQMGHTPNYIVTELLPVHSPDIKWDDTDNLVFQYHYDFFMPAGIMPHFIVRIHENIEKAEKGKYLCWREGAVLSSDGARAYVRAIPGERRIEIRVEGNHKKKRELLAIIRNDFEHINKKFQKITISRKIPCQCMPGCTKLFDYNRLCKMEVKGIKEEFCEVNSETVRIEELLDGVETKEKRREAAMGDTFNIEQNIYAKNVTNVTGKEIKIQEWIQHADSTTYEKLVKELSTLEDALRDKVTSSPNNKEYKEAVDAVENAKKAAEAKDGEGVMKWLKRAGKFGYEAANAIPNIATAANGIIKIFEAVV